MRYTSTLEYALLAVMGIAVVAVFVAPTITDAGAMLARVAAMLPH